MCIALYLRAQQDLDADFSHRVVDVDAPERVLAEGRPLVAKIAEVVVVWGSMISGKTVTSSHGKVLACKC